MLKSLAEPDIDLKMMRRGLNRFLLGGHTNVMTVTDGLMLTDRTVLADSTVLTDGMIL